MMNETSSTPLDHQYMLDFTNIRDVSPPLDKPDNSGLLGPASSSEGSSTASSDAPSPASNGSPAEWCFWDGPPHTSTGGESGGSLGDDPWSWAKMDLDAIASATDANSVKGLPFDPNTLNFEDAFGTQLMIPSQTNALLPSTASPADILGLPNLLQTLASLPMSVSAPEANFQESTPTQPHLGTDIPAQVQLPSSQMCLQPNHLPSQEVSFNSSLALNTNAEQLSHLGDLDEIAMKARQRAGVQVAISSPNLGTAVNATEMPQKLPIPRLIKHVVMGRPPLAKHSRQSPVSSSPGAADSPDHIPQSDPQVLIGASGRPKTSHTTIERRYRTNLNARITALKHAVPALRILDKDLFPDEKVDERGYVDGVKAARKSSKASVLGKAVEYINVLKNREIRLRRENQGLKSLLNSLVGGPALLREWEAGWLEKYGGEEADEAVLESECDDEEGSDDEEEKPRKKPRISKPTTPLVKKEQISSVSPTSGVTETGKRKRGRPKKVSDTTISHEVPLVAHFGTDLASHRELQSNATAVPVSADSSPAKYLLGVFLFFSFFKPSPNTSVHKPQTHSNYSGSVVTHPGVSSPPSSILAGFRLSDLAHHSHTVISAILILSLLWPFISSLHLGRWLRHKENRQPADQATLQIKGRGSLEDWHRLRRLLGIGTTFTEAAGAVAQSFSIRHRERNDTKLEKLWNGMAVVHLLNEASLGYAAKWSIALGLYARRPWNPSSSDLCSLALLFYPVSRYFAHKLWAKASTAHGTESDAICLRMNLEEAASLFNRAVSSGILDRFAADEVSVLSVIAEMLSLEAVKTMAGALFVKAVDNQYSLTQAGLDGEELGEVAEWVSVIGSNTRSQVKDTLRIWDTVWKVFNAKETYDELDSVYDMEDYEASAIPTLFEEVRDLLHSLILLQRSRSMRNGSNSTSPESMTPTPSSKSFGPVPVPRISIKLRQLLASSAFEGEEGLENARDIVVDRLSWQRDGY
ncbi:hypothetical protein FRC03_004099 [Tulasnella sp. 419]|nr:hypothetical protein FRC03_004099 [Tulasnella sp. 419]